MERKSFEYQQQNQQHINQLTEQGIESLQQQLLEDLVCPIAIPIARNIFAIEAGTGSGKTHSLLEQARQDKYDNSEPAKTIISSTTRAMVQDIQHTGNQSVAGGERFVGRWIGGEGGRDIQNSDSIIAMTGGKLYDILLKDPTLGSLTYVLSEGDESNNRGVRDVQQVDTLIIDEADGMEQKLIPAIKWLSTVRPDMKIFFVSATLNIPEFQTMYNIAPDMIYTAPEAERPRPITVSYAEDEELNSIFGSKENPRIATKTYTQEPLNKLQEWLDTESELPLEPGESVIVFMPTIYSTEKFARSVEGMFGNQVEVRTLHSKLEKDEMFTKQHQPISPGKVGVFVSTDIAGRGVNFEKDLNLNRAIHSGVVNRPIYSPHTRREIMRVIPASKQEVAQGLGRAGRNVEDSRPVLGHTGFYEDAIQDSMRNTIIEGDPTYLILESAGFLKSITKTNVPSEYKPKSLEQYLQTLDNNPETKGQYRAKIKSSLARLYGIEALDSENNVTEFGSFLLKTKLPIDYAIMVYESLEAGNTARVVRMVSMINNMSYLITNHISFGGLTNLVAHIYPDIQSDLEVYDKILEVCQPYAESHQSIRHTEQDFSEGVAEINRIIKSGKEHNPQKALDEVIQKVFELDLGKAVGMRLEVFEDIDREQDRILNTLQKEGYKSSQEQTESQANEEQLLQKLAIYALPHTIMRKVKRTRSGLVYQHLPSGEQVTIAKDSLIQDSEPDYAIASNIYHGRNTLIASGLQGVTLDSMVAADKYTSWLVREDERETTQYDMETGDIREEERVIFQDYRQNTQRVLRTKTLSTSGAESPQKAHELFVAELSSKPQQYIQDHFSNRGILNYYNSLSDIGNLSGAELPHKGEGDLHNFYKDILEDTNLKTIPELKAAKEQGRVSLEVGAAQLYKQEQLQRINELMEKYPQSYEGARLQYKVFDIEGVQKPYASIDLKGKEFIKFYKEGFVHEIEELTGLTVAHIKEYTSYPIEISDFLESEVRTEKQRILQESLNDADSEVKVIDIKAIESTAELEKLKPLEIGKDPLENSILMAYPSLSKDGWGNLSMYWSVDVQDIKENSVYIELYTKFAQQESNASAMQEYEDNRQSYEAKIQELLDKVDQDTANPDYVTIINKLEELDQMIGEQDERFESRMDELDQVLELELSYLNRGEVALQIIEQKANELLDRYTQAKYSRNQINTGEYEEAITDELVVDGEVLAYIEFSHDYDKDGYIPELRRTPAYSEFEENPKFSSYEIKSKGKLTQKVEKEVSAEELEAEQQVADGNYMYDRIVTNPDKRAKLAKTVLDHINPKTNLSESERERVRKFIISNKAVSANLKPREYYNEEGGYVQDFVITSINTEDINLEPKARYYIDLSKQKSELVATDGFTRVLIIEQAKIQAPLPDSKKKKESEEPAPAVDQGLLAGLANKFGRKK